MPTRFKVLVILLIALIVSCPGKVCADKKDKRPSKMMSVALPEPDMLPAKAAKSKIIQTPLEAQIKTSWENVPLEGIDVSHYQGLIDWQAISKNKNIGYVFIKATEGESLVDDTYRYNIEEARKAGLKVGSYHYYRPNADMEMQFQNLTSQIRSNEQDLAVIIDVENRGRKSHATFISDLKKFIKRVEEHYKSKPIIYTFQNFYNKYLSGEFSGYKLMVAKYHEEEPELNDGSKFTIWQYTSKGEIEGIDGFVDRSMIMPGFTMSDIMFAK